MNVEETIVNINYLYDKYLGDNSFIKDINCNELIKRMKEVLAELDIKKSKPYDKSDSDLIKDIYSSWC